MVKVDILNKIYGMEFLDEFHDYPGGDYGLIRYYHKKKARIVMKNILKFQDKNKTLLDAGCGRGPYVFLAKNYFKKIFAFEYDVKELNFAKKNNYNNEKIIYNQVDLTNIPLETESIDYIICSEVLEHIPDYQKACNECYRVLKKGGKMILSMPNGSSLFYKIAKIRNQNKIDMNNHKDWESARHWHFSFKDIERIVKNSGFKIIERDGSTILRIPHKIKELFMKKSPVLFIMIEKLDNFLSNLLPIFAVNYFLTLKKK
ncbi:MAG: class I SAM-dependent methyltransferase [Candidatus Absconditabacterales bacterium]|nr:class I SAM-dependent methyltransferase [Candidatus Absconditabacterales bacterium]